MMTVVLKVRCQTTQELGRNYSAPLRPTDSETLGEGPGGCDAQRVICTTSTFPLFQEETLSFFLSSGNWYKVKTCCAHLKRHTEMQVLCVQNAGLDTMGTQKNVSFLPIEYIP